MALPDVTKYQAYPAMAGMSVFKVARHGPRLKTCEGWLLAVENEKIRLDVFSDGSSIISVLSSGSHMLLSPESTRNELDGFGLKICKAEEAEP